MSLATASTAVRLRSPLAPTGRPTQMNTASASASASSTSAVNAIRPASICSRSSSCRPGSWKEHRPRRSDSIVSALASTPTTSWPRLASETPVTSPTRPVPTIAMRMWRASIRTGRQDRSRRNVRRAYRRGVRWNRPGSVGHVRPTNESGVMSSSTAGRTIATACPGFTDSPSDAIQAEERPGEPGAHLDPATDRPELADHGPRLQGSPLAHAMMVQPTPRRSDQPPLRDRRELPLERNLHSRSPS